MRIDRLRARAKTTPRGEWIYTLGGWAMEQFADDRTPFTRTELDRAVPDPMFVAKADPSPAALAEWRRIKSRTSRR